MKDAVGTLQNVGGFSSVGSVVAGAAGAVANGGSAAAGAITAAVTDKAYDTGSIVDAALEGLEKLEKKLQERNGVAIWIYLEWEECVLEDCCIFWSRYDWADKEDWHKCAAEGEDRPLVGFDADDKAGIAKAIPKCVKEAVKAATEGGEE